MGETGVRGAPGKLGHVVSVAIRPLTLAPAQTGPPTARQTHSPSGALGRLAVGSFDVEGVGALWDGHGGPWGWRARGVVVRRGGASTGVVARKADAGAPASVDVVGGGGTLDKQRACGRALATLVPLGEGQQRVLVAL